MIPERSIYHGDPEYKYSPDTHEEVTDCARCGRPVLSEFNATETKNGLVHDLCMASYKQFGPMYSEAA